MELFKNPKDWVDALSLIYTLECVVDDSTRFPLVKSDRKILIDGLEKLSIFIFNNK